jgi:hypothetical protein
MYAVLLCAGFMATPVHLSSQPAPRAATGESGPKLTFTTNEYHFGKVIAGAQVKYVFIASNSGDQTLKISNVAPGCHCTTAGIRSLQIEPGKTGEIPIQFDSGSFRGDVRKNITVTSNDKLAPNQTLLLIGTIWRAIEVSPQFAYINITPDSPSNPSTVVHITNQGAEPITLSDPTSASGAFKAELKTIKPGKEFEVTVTALSIVTPGNTSGTISLKTSLTNMPVLNITAVAMMQPALAVVPAQIVLPPQITGWTTNVITITANGSKMLVLSSLAACCDKAIKVELKEINPGRVFQLVAAFPPGFQVAAGQEAELSVKSNNAQHPVITVPIRQLSHQAVIPGPSHLKAMSQNPPSPQASGHP